MGAVLSALINVLFSGLQQDYGWVPQSGPLNLSILVLIHYFLHWLQPTIWPGVEGLSVGREPAELNFRSSPNATA